MANQNNFVVKNGMTLPRDPSASMEATTKQYVDAKFNGVTAAGIGAALRGANTDITSLAGLTTAISMGQGGTGAKNATDARTNLGLGTLATQNSSAVSIAGGAINATPIGSNTPSTGYFTSLQASESITGNLNGNVSGTAANVTGVVSVANGGTGANNSATARSNLGAAPISNPSFTGTVTATGALNVGNTDVDGVINLQAGLHGGIEIGKVGRTLAGTPYIDFHSAVNTADYDVRLIVNGGDTANVPGKGLLNIHAARLENNGYPIWTAQSIPGLNAVNGLAWGNGAGSYSGATLAQVKGYLGIPTSSGFLATNNTPVDQPVYFSSDIGRLSGAVLHDAHLSFKDYGVLAAGSTQYINFADAHHVYIKVTGALTLQAANVALTNTGMVMVELVNGAAFPVTWDSRINWYKNDGTGDTTTNFTQSGNVLHAAGTDFVILWARNGVIYGKVVR